jgi:hypothetical protein
MTAMIILHVAATYGIIDDRDIGAGRPAHMTMLYTYTIYAH